MKPLKILSFLLVLCLFPDGAAHAKNTKKKSNPQKEYLANIVTDLGTVSFVLLDETPVHRDNFVALVKKGYYRGMDFHRVVENFVIQAGDPGARGEYDHNEIGEGDVGYTLPPEIDGRFRHFRGAVGMAREDDSSNPERRSSGSHFYIVQGKYPLSDGDLDKTEARTGRKIPRNIRAKYRKEGGSPHLDGAYTVFGYVVGGMPVVDSIARRAVNLRGVPDDPVTIRQIFLLKRDPKGGKRNKTVSYETEY